MPRKTRFILLLLFAAGISGAQDIVERNNFLITPVSPKIVRLLNEMPSSIDPTLPAPRLFPEPPYTIGRTNTVYWSSLETRDILDQNEIDGEILFYEIRAYSDSTGQLWGFVDADTDSATFTGLPSSVPFYYNLRYYFQSTAGEYALSFWNSDSTSSIQDAHSPVLSDISILDLKGSGTKNWMTKSTMEIQVEAADPENGKIAQIRINEKSDSYSGSISYDIDIPQTEINEIIPYELNSDQHELITLTFTVIDAAGQNSAPVSIILFWWELEGIVCFPNPFNPDLGEVSTIETGNTEIKEARIYDPFGDLVIRLTKTNSTFFQWNGKNEDGSIVSNGGYICVIDNGEKQYCKIAVLR